MADLLPPPLSENESFKAIMEITEERFAAIPIDQCIVNEIDNVTPEALLTLAHQFAAYKYREWIYHYTDRMKRDRIKSSVGANSIDGTPGAIKVSGRVFGQEFEFIEGEAALQAKFPLDNPANFNWYNYVCLLRSSSDGNEPFQLTAKGNFTAANESWKNARSEMLFFLIEYVITDNELAYQWSDTPVDEGDPDPGEDGLEIDLYLNNVYQYTY